MKSEEVVDQLRSDVAGARVYGEPYETVDGVTIITTARIRGRADPARFTATPIGAFVIKDGRASWTPAVDATRIARLGVLVGLLSAVIGALAVLRRPPWPDLSRRALLDT